MANVKAETKRAIVSAIARASTVVGLLAGLQQFQDAAFAANKGGKSLASSSGAGHSAMFTILESMPPDEVLGFSQELLETFSAAKAAIGGSPSDDDILARMLLADNMNAVTRHQTDYTNIRIGQTLGGPI